MLRNLLQVLFVHLFVLLIVRMIVLALFVVVVLVLFVVVVLVTLAVFVVLAVFVLVTLVMLVTLAVFVLVMLVTLAIFGCSVAFLGVGKGKCKSTCDSPGGERRLHTVFREAATGGEEVMRRRETKLNSPRLPGQSSRPPSLLFS